MARLHRAVRVGYRSNATFIRTADMSASFDPRWETLTRPAARAAARVSKTMMMIITPITGPGRTRAT